MDGGTGSDSLDGGGGPDDTADYSSRTRGFAVSLESSLDAEASSFDWNDGEDGEGDIVLDCIERVRGGSGDDLLSGSDGDNVLVGNGGLDGLDGRGGNDYLVTAYDGSADSVQCGNGYDRVIADSADIIGPGCESVTLVSS